jgi:hypothetical protein
MLLPVTFCSALLGVSRQRVYQLMDEGRMERVEVHGQTFITEESLIAWARAEHKNGRPLKVPQTFKEGWTVAREFAKAK